MSTKIWVPSESKVWDLGIWIGEDLTTNQVTVEIYDDKTKSSKQITVSKSVTHPLDDTHLMDLNDLCLMNNLHEAPLLHVLKQRLVAKNIYTFTGDVLISLNPYQVIGDLYSDPLKYFSHNKSYDLDDKNAADPDNEKQVGSKSFNPSVYCIANSALQSLMYREFGMASKTGRTVQVNQSVIVSGESGAGKTEAAKHVMNFLIAANESIIQKAHSIIPNDQSLGDRIKNVLLQSSIVLEAFGNSKTVRNDNSSRFGKYIKLMYTADNELVSAFTETFLLEKSRLVYVGQDERNYHIFYQLLRGLSSTNADLLGELKLISVDSFKMLIEGKCTVVTSESDDNRDFVALDYALNVLGFSTEEKGQLWKVLACILHLGNITFTPAASDTDYPILNSPIMNIEEIATILGLPENQLNKRISSQFLRAGKRESYKIKILTAEESQNNVSALLKWLYKCVFAWLVQKINNAHASIDSSRVSVKFIGILDIFGFEILRTNSFEQLCINYTNERLQQQFNERVFVFEQEDYANEGLNWNTISFKDNQHVIDLISKKPQGLLMILEEHGMLNRKPDDVALLKNFNQAHDGGHPAYIKSRFGNDGFVIKHFAGDVTYTIDSFLSKNNDSLQDDLMTLFGASSNSFVLDLMGGVLKASEGETETKKMAASVTVSYQFRNQLDDLTTTLRSTDPHYIKCIKPNSIKAPFTFDPVMVNEQLRYSGALEVVRIRREGFPTRMKFQQFYSDYEILSRGKGWKSTSTCSESEAKSYATRLLSDHLSIDLYQIGNRLVFMRNGCLEILRQAILNFYSKFAIIVQSSYRKHNCEIKYKRQKVVLAKLQSVMRMIPKKKQFQKTIAETRSKEAEKEAARVAEEKRLAEIEAARIQKDVELQRQLEEKQKKEVAEALTKKTEMANKRICNCIGTYRRNKILKKELNHLYKLCSDGNIIGIDEYFRKHPNDMHIRSKYHNFNAPIQAAFIAGQAGLVEFLKPNYPKDILTSGNSAIHSAAAKPSNRNFVLLASTIDEMTKDLRSLVETMKILDIKPGVLNIRGQKTASILKSLSGSNVIKEGWASKRREGNKWERRWVTINESQISYFKDQSEKIPRGVITLKGTTVQRVKGDKPMLEIICPELSKKFSLIGPKPTNSMFFLFSSEIELQEWLNVWKGLLINDEVIRTKPFNYIDVSGRKRVLSTLNSNRETPLHVIAKSCILNEDVVRISSPGEENDTILINDVLKMAFWLIENGCPIDIKNSFGKSALDVANEKSNQTLIKCLNSKNECKKVHFHLPGPHKLPQYSYLSIHMQCQTFVPSKKNDSYRQYSDLFMVISVYNARKTLVESVQVINRPVITRPESVWWATTWHMTTPIENIDNGSFILIEIKAGAGLLTSSAQAASGNTIYWVSHIIEKEEINSGDVIFNLLKGSSQIDWAVQRKSIDTIQTENLLETEFLITRL